MLIGIPVSLTMMVTLAFAIPEAAISRPRDSFQFVNFGGARLAGSNIVFSPNRLSGPSFAARSVDSIVPVVATARAGNASPQPKFAKKDYGVASSYPRTDPASSSYGK